MRQPIIHPKFQGQVAGSWTSKVTIQQVTYSTSAANQKIVSGATDIGGMIDIPCRMAPSVITGTFDDEMRPTTLIAAQERRILKLNGYFPQIVQRTMVAKVDGTTWQIRGVEHDSQHYSTRLRLEIIKA